MLETIDSSHLYFRLASELSRCAYKLRIDLVFVRCFFKRLSMVV
jgi:hypothetical protein